MRALDCVGHGPGSSTLLASKSGAALCVCVCRCHRSHTLSKMDQWLKKVPARKQLAKAEPNWECGAQGQQWASHHELCRAQRQSGHIPSEVDWKCRFFQEASWGI